jgi:[ribosomal protein S5]-alanine N-acetyltransferase
MSSARRLVTERLVIATATHQHLLVEQSDPAKLEPLLGARVPPEWPRDPAEAALLRETMTALHKGPQELGWWLRYVVQRRGPDGHPWLIGRVGLRGPAKDGQVHVRCMLLPAFTGEGQLREAAGCLVDWALDHPEVQRVVAEPAVAEEAWIQALRELGFVHESDELEDAERGVARFVRQRAAWLQDSVALRRGAKLVPREANVPVAGIPKLARPVFERLLREPLRDPEDLRREVVLYVNMLAHTAADNPSVDPELGRDIGRTCEGLLMAIGLATPEHARRQIQAAVRYFVTEEDGDSDLEIGGLDEDAAVANAVAIHLGRSDLATHVD